MVEVLGCGQGSGGDDLKSKTKHTPHTLLGGLPQTVSFKYNLEVKIKINVKTTI